eukprot:CAMPEP_0206368362 /NCGR_PEP_ID=MMETSP0294-20121207/4626_1 /ASSEMBLY_ACC=CAM_ASM_000327 /TAXON_ID=39354 /ORGANISM="Heterosigma akashiwo, Strain CCMP2393" /LENGTH=64 /DNA_ID=CAMNT_0053814851 /DNA_START=363 /DNA_END=555 /DNA_ORIENTATION=-
MTPCPPLPPLPQTLSSSSDMLNDVGKMPGSRMFMPHAPSAVGDLKEQLASFAAKGVAASSAAAR